MDRYKRTTKENNGRHAPGSALSDKPLYPIPGDDRPVYKYIDKPHTQSKIKE